MKATSTVKANDANLVKDKPIKSCSHGDDEENVGQIASIEQQEPQHGLKEEEIERGERGREECASVIEI